MANTTIISKLSNDNILVNANGNEFTIDPTYTVHKDVNLDIVFVRDSSGVDKNQFRVVDIEKVIRKDLTEILIADINTLFTELITFFFFKLAGGGGGTSPNLSHLGNFTNYTDLITQFPTSTVGDLAYVENSQGIQWLPGSFGGTFYSKGTYLWNGAIWDSAVDEIADAIENMTLSAVLDKGNTANSGQHIILKDTGKIKIETGSGPFSTRLEMGVEGNDVVLRAPNSGASGDDILIDVPNIGNWVKFRSGIFSGDAGFQAIGNAITTFISKLTGIDRTITFQDKDYTVAGLNDILKQKVGKALNVDFIGNPKKAVIGFTTPFSDANYSPQLICETINNRSFSPVVESITANSFVINMDVNNINNLVSVRFTATKFGEN